VRCSWLVIVHGCCHEIGVERVRAFLVRLPSGTRYWTLSMLLLPRRG
jgi:hypothetical protein